MDSRAKRMLSMVLNKQQAEKIVSMRSLTSTRRVPKKTEIDPDYVNLSSGSESEDASDHNSDKINLPDQPTTSNAKLKVLKKIFGGQPLVQPKNQASDQYLNAKLNSEPGIIQHSVSSDICQSRRSESVEVVTDILEAVLNNAIESLYTEKGQKRKRRKYSTSLTERKRLRKEKIITQHTVKSACKDICKKKCITKINCERRSAINKEYWIMTPKEQKTFMFNNVTKTLTKRHTAGADSRRKFTNRYVLKDQAGTAHEVCKIFFLSTLGFKNKCDKRLRTVLKNTSRESLQATKDLRGQRTPSNKIDKIPMIQHINSFRPSISHYRREHAPNRKYLPTDLNVQIMYNHFVVQNPDMKGSYELYRKLIHEMNISFVKLGHEECFSCEKFFLHEKEYEHKRDSPCSECINCQEYITHKKKAEEARTNYIHDKQDDKRETIFYSADLQKVIMLPRYESLKEVIFTGRIIAFNESFVPLGSQGEKKKPIAIIWHEGVAGRSKTDIISTFYAFFLHHRDDKHLVLWLDNCSSQNKNWALLAFFVYIVNSKCVNLENLEIKFFEPGHTFMSADSFHHQVEMSLKRKDKVLDFSDFIDCVQKSNSGRVSVKVMNYADFFDWEDFTSQHKLKTIQPRPYLKDMVHLKFSRGAFNIQYKTSFSGNPITLNFLYAKVIKNGFPNLSPRKSDRGIPTDRKKTIISKLGSVIPTNRMEFWQNLPTTSSSLEEEVDVEDE